MSALYKEIAKQQQISFHISDVKLLMIENISPSLQVARTVIMIQKHDKGA